MSSSNSSSQSLAWAGVVVVLGVTSWFGWRTLRDAKPESAAGPAAGGRPPSTVIVKPAVRKETVESLSVTGTLRAVRRADVAAREAAAVESLLVDEGDRVEEGAVLAKLDGRRLEAQLQEAQASLTAARAELAQREAEHDRAIKDEEMMRGLWEERAVSEREFLDSDRELKVAAARENAAREAIEAAQKRFDLIEVRRADLEVKAPFAGRVVARHTEVGEWVTEGAAVVTLLSTGEIEAWLQIPERHIAGLKAAAPDAVELRLPGRAEPIRADKLSLVPDVEGRSRLFNLIAHIPDPDNQLTPGSSVEARVPLGKPTEHLVVSADAVLSSFSGTFVFVPAPAPEGPPMAKRVTVEVLFERDGESVLAAGELEAGDQVIVEGNERLFPGTPLDPRPWEETRAESSPETAGSR
ncbi:efflux RND transporter periplasmic adaptor subunit [Luteolibacter marinus]|uniref:efflux RND transporter periplasmic adaptor subunit n=1 Tax=Luteolibacter marinus TaxID=2776705 RepID=UPI001868AE3C|nr:efflux RND transporter periplasmic adaptor subunit [Luteolibacter marinus]